MRVWYVWEVLAVELGRVHDVNIQCKGEEIDCWFTVC